MSFFPNMFGLPVDGTTRSYLLHINDQGDCVVYLLDKDGNPVDFCAGSPDEVLGEPLRLGANRYVMIDLGDKDVPSPWKWGFWGGGDSWANVAAVLNGKASQSRGEYMGVFQLLVEHGLRDFLTGWPRFRNVALTPRAMEADKAALERRAKRMTESDE